MADGSAVIKGRIVQGMEAATLTLSQALSAGYVVCRCAGRCGQVESADVRPWLCSATNRGTALGTLSRRLRCICGSREVRLEVWSVAPLKGRASPRVIHWRA